MENISREANTWNFIETICNVNEDSKKKELIKKMQNELEDDIPSDCLRVTAVLSPFTGIEFIPENILKPASMRGTLVHEKIQDKLSGFDFPSDNETTAGFLKSFDIFWDSSEQAFSESKMTLEKRLYCHKFNITGQIDCILEIDDKTFIFDWKTSARPSPSWQLQAAAYRYLCEVNGYQNISGLTFVRLKKDGSKPVLYHYNDSYHENLIIFSKCIELYKFFRMDKTRRKW